MAWDMASKQALVSRTLIRVRSRADHTIDKDLTIRVACKLKEEPILTKLNRVLQEVANKVRPLLKNATKLCFKTLLEIKLITQVPLNNIFSQCNKTTHNRLQPQLQTLLKPTMANLINMELNKWHTTHKELTNNNMNTTINSTTTIIMQDSNRKLMDSSTPVHILGSKQPQTPLRQAPRKIKA